MDTGIIGGADGPTEIFLASSGSASSYLVVVGIVLCVAVAAMVVRAIKKRKM